MPSNEMMLDNLPEDQRVDGTGAFMELEDELDHVSRLLNSSSKRSLETFLEQHMEEYTSNTVSSAVESLFVSEVKRRYKDPGLNVC